MADVYVKLDDVINIIREVNWNLGGLIQHLKEHCPTADVEPKSEVDRLVDKWIGSGELTPDEKTLRLVDELRCEANRYVRYYFNHEYDKLIAEAKAEVAREIFEEMEENLLKIVMFPCINAEGCVTPMRASYWRIDPNDYAELKKKYTEGTDGKM